MTPAKGMLVVRAAVHPGVVDDVMRRLAADTRVTGAASNLPVRPADEVPFHALVEVWSSPRDLDAVVRAAVEAFAPATVDAYEVVEHRPVDEPVTARRGQPSPGVRMVSLCRRSTGMGREEFARYWRDAHAPVAMSFTVPIRRYSQNVVVRTVTAGAPDLDGIAWLHFHSEAEMRTRYADHPDEAARGAADARRFMDLDGAQAVTMVETVWR